MAILDQYGNPVSSESSPRFSGSTLIGDRSIPPQKLWKDDFEKLVPEIDRQYIVSGSRRLFQNFGPWSTPMVQKADNVIGRAWAPKFLGDDKEWGKIAVDWLANQWYGNCDVRGLAWDFKTLLWLDSVTIDRDGDFLIYLTEAESGYPLTQRISCNRIGQRNSYGADQKVTEGKYKGLKITHGVIRDKLNRAVAYRILGDTPAEDVDIEASRCRHVIDPLWHDQVRGIPSGQAAIKLIFGSLTATEREQLNQNIRSSYALVEYNESGGPDLEDPAIQAQIEARKKAGITSEITDPTIESLAGGMIKYFRSNSGGKLEAVDNDTPGDMWDRFQDRVVRTHAAAVNWPYELYWKNGEVNAALVRNIQERARMSVEDRQDVIKSPALFQIRYAIAKAIKIGLLPKPKNAADWWKFDFQMPRKFSIDPGKEAAQRREDYRIAFRSRTSIAAEDGGDAETIEDEKIEEAFRYEKKIRAREEAEGFKVDRRQFVMMGPNEQAEDQAGKGKSADKNDPEKDTEE